MQKPVSLRESVGGYRLPGEMREALVTSLVNGMGEEEVTAGMVEELILYAEEISINYAHLQAAVMGWVGVRVEGDGAIVFVDRKERGDGVANQS